MPCNFIGGLVEGVNYPIPREGEETAFHINVDKCNDMIVVDRKYFLKHLGFIHSWALHVEKKKKTHVIENKITES